MNNLISDTAATTVIGDSAKLLYIVLCNDKTSLGDSDLLLAYRMGYASCRKIAKPLTELVKAKLIFLDRDAVDGERIISLSPVKTPKLQQQPTLAPMPKVGDVLTTCHKKWQPADLWNEMLLVCKRKPEYVCIGIKFFQWWTEQIGTMLKFQKQTTWNTEGRLRTWYARTSDEDKKATPSERIGAMIVDKHETVSISTKSQYFGDEK